MKPLKPYRVIRALQRAGFYIHHQKGSHIQLRHRQDKRKYVTLPSHKKELPPKTLKSILSQAGISLKRLRDLL